ncbi:zinc finger, C2H2 type [Onchocerca flexuosa]|uniref:Zinc finger, C2H2 type n=1 Tax=Onchocerca flexuosa TaxID=387005 RepID=A0A238C5P3_9BILA|nr:zinc finger, C2H2 type [Onchocerca flexuosa]
MRKKQAKPAKRLAGVVFPDEDGSGEDSGGSLSPVWHSPSSSSAPDSRIISATERDHSTGNSFRASAMKNAADDNDFHSDAPLLKIPKHEPDNFGNCCRDAECPRFSRSHFAHYGSLNGHNSRTVAGYAIPIISRASDYHKSFLSMLTANRNSTQSNSFDTPSTSISPADESIESTDSESPLKRLERCVRASNVAECSTFGFYRNSKPSASARYSLTQSRPNNNSMKLRFGYDSTKTSAADALGELSQLVHRIGTAKLPIPTVPSKCIPNSITSNIFTCLKCAQRFETLDELVLHIRTTKHFTRESIRNFDAVAPWERNRVAANFEKQAASSNFLASLFYAQKCLGVSFALDNFVIFILLKEY